MMVGIEEYQYRYVIFGCYSYVVAAGDALVGKPGPFVPYLCKLLFQLSVMFHPLDGNDSTMETGNFMSMILVVIGLW